MAVNQGILRKYRARLVSIPAPGGNGCHPALLAIANLGFIAGLSADKIFLDIWDHIPPGQRRVSDSEIWDAINRALADHGNSTFTPQPRTETVVKDGSAALRKIIDQAKITTEVDLWESSPVRLLEAP